MLPVISSFMAAHRLRDVTVVADAGRISEANQQAIQAAGLSFILGTRIAHLPYAVQASRNEHPRQDIPDGHVFCQPWPATAAEKAGGIPDRVIYYQYRHDRARRTRRGIDEQVAKAERAVAGKAPVKRNRYVKLTGATTSVNRDLEAKARGLAGLKGYTTNLIGATAEFVIDAYHRLWRIEKSFRMSKHDLQARPVYHHKRDSIEAHLSIVFAALGLSHWIERQTGWSIKKFVRTARRYRTVKIRAGRQTLTAADPYPTNSATPSPRSTRRAVRTSLAEVGYWAIRNRPPYCVGTLAAIWLAMLTAESVGLALHVLTSITTLFLTASARPQAQPGALAFC